MISHNEFACIRASDQRRPGKVLVFFALLLVFLMGLVAVAVDLGVMATGRTELQMAADAGAMAGAGQLPEQAETVAAEALRFTRLNLGDQAESPNTTVTVELGDWDRSKFTFTPSDSVINAVRVVVELANQPLFFARALGNDSYQLRAEAIASYAPRDMMIVLDLSASMNDDSEFRQMDQLGEAAILNGLWDIYQDLGSPTYGDLQWETEYISPKDKTNKVLKRLKLDKVTYPYPAGSWEEYVGYVKNSYNLARAGYLNRYGYPTLINYWLELRPAFHETPDLWQTREQPVTAVKNAVTLFVDFVKQGQVDDRLGLVVYSFTENAAMLETGLDYDLDLTDSIARQRQAGHYVAHTNIASGLKEAIDELDANARPNAVKRIVMMTDGVATRPGRGQQPKKAALAEASRAAAAGYPIITISLGSGADQSLCQEIADMTDGVHFNIPGGGTIAEYDSELRKVFETIAKDRPLRLVK